MFNHSWTVHLLAIVTCIQWIDGQTMRQSILCKDEIVRAHASGFIHYIPGVYNRECTLTLIGLFAGSYFSFTNLQKQTSQGCPVLDVNDEKFCIGPSEYEAITIMKLRNHFLTLKLSSPIPNSVTIRYYGQVGECGKHLVLPEQLKLGHLSGILTSSYDRQPIPIATKNCFASFSLPTSSSTAVKYEILEATKLVYRLRTTVTTFESNDPGNTLLVLKKEEAAVLYYSNENSTYTFIVRFEILHCNNVPHVPNTVHTTTANPFLPGTNVTYTCVSGRLPSSPDSTLQCKVVNSSQRAVWSDHSKIKCVADSDNNGEDSTTDPGLKNGKEDEDTDEDDPNGEVNEQDLITNVLCRDQEGFAHSSGIVQYIPGHYDKNCKLSLNGFIVASHISLPKLRKQTSGNCSVIMVNSERCCLKDSEYGESVVIKLKNSYITFEVSSNATYNATFHYYNQVGSLNSPIIIPEKPAVEHLTGIFISSYDLTPMTTPNLSWASSVQPLPNPPNPIKFELLHSEGLEYNLKYDGVDVDFQSEVFGNSSQVVASNMNINITYFAGEDPTYSFIIKFQVIQCGKVPFIPNTVHSVTSKPWLPGSNVTYKCNPGWILQNLESSVECKIDEMKKANEWSDSSRIKCVIERQCYYLPSNLANAVYQLSEDKLSALYNCINSYPSKRSVSDRTITCSSPDEQNVPFTWSLPKFECVVVDPTNEEFDKVSRKTGIAVAVSCSVIVVASAMGGIAYGYKKAKSQNNDEMKASPTNGEDKASPTNGEEKASPTK